VWYRLVDQSDNYVTEQFCRSILEPLPPNAVILLKSDHIEFPVRYLQARAAAAGRWGAADPAARRWRGSVRTWQPSTLT
jgi:hypothetical protein